MGNEDGATTGTPGMMRWPPPGLERMQGDLGAIMMRGALSGLLLVLPILFVTGAEDRLISPAAIEEMHRQLPGSEFALVPGAGHSVYYEMPRLFNRLVIEFLKRHTARATR